MANIDVIFVLIYVLFVICVVYPPAEIVSVGLTPTEIFGKLLGSQQEQFVQYHIKRTSLTLLIYSLLPLLFIGGINLFLIDQTSAFYQLLQSQPFVYVLGLTLGLGLPLLALVQIYMFHKNIVQHPIIKAVEKFANANSNFESISGSINNEYRSVNKVCIQTSPITRIVVTENWIMKVLPLSLSIAHQSDASLTVKHSVTHEFSLENTGTAQYLTIEVKSRRTDPFLIRLNALDFQDVQDRVARCISISPQVKFHRSLTDKFVDAFKDAIKENAKYIQSAKDTVDCIGCMQTKSNVKLQRYCEDSPTGDNCTPCYCEPMWCIDCLASWFAHRQDGNPSDTWFSAKCTCPTCRATFCILDVCPIILLDPN